jgi:hypothetical protein
VMGASPGTAPANCTATTCTTGVAIAIDGATTVGFSGTGYPADNVAPTMVAGQPTMTPALCMHVWQAILGGNGPSIAIAAATGIDWVPTAATQTCTYTYYGGTTTATARVFTYSVSTGAMALTNA